MNKLSPGKAPSSQVLVREARVSSPSRSGVFAQAADRRVERFTESISFDHRLAEQDVEESPDCISGLVLQGVKKPNECPAFGVRCTPERPLGAPMVSSEGACAAYFRYRHADMPVAAGGGV